MDYQLVVAARDRRLNRDAYRVLLELHTRLDWREHRTAKLWALAKTLHLHEASVSRAITRLREAGYLEAGPRDESRRTYRLSLPVGVAPDATREAA